MRRTLSNIEGRLPDGKRSDLRFSSGYLLKFIWSQLLPTIVELYITLSISMAKEWQRNWIARIVSFNATRLGVMHFLLWVDYITARGRYMTSELQSLKNISRGRKDERARQSLILRLKSLRETQKDLWILARDINVNFKWFILSKLATLFISIIIDLYWIFGNLRFGDNPFMLRK